MEGYGRISCDLAGGSEKDERTTRWALPVPDTEGSCSGLSFFPGQRQQEDQSFPAVSPTRYTLSREQGHGGSDNPPYLKRLSHCNRSGSWNTTSTVASTSFTHPSLAEIHCYWKQPTTDLTNTNDGDEGQESSQTAQQLFYSRPLSPAPHDRPVDRHVRQGFFTPSPLTLMPSLHIFPSEPLQFHPPCAKRDPDATEVPAEQHSNVLYDGTWLANSDTDSDNARRALPGPSCGSRLESRAGVTHMQSCNLTKTATVLLDARSAPISEAVIPSEFNESRQRNALADFRSHTRKETILCGSRDSVPRGGVRETSPTPGVRHAFQAIAALKVTGSRNLHSTSVRPRSQPEPVEHTLLKLRVRSEGARRTCLRQPSSKIDGTESPFSPSTNSRDIRYSLSEPVLPIEELGQLLEFTDERQAGYALSRTLQAIPQKLLPFQSSSLHNFLSTWRHIASERQLLRRLSSDAKQHRAVRILRHAFLALRMSAHTRAQLRIKREICHLEALAHTAQRHFLAWLRIHYAASARKVFLKKFGLIALRAAVTEGHELTTTGEAARHRSLKFRVLRAFASYRLAQIQARVRADYAAIVYKHSLLKKGMRGWCKWHAYISACTKLLTVASQLEEARRREILSMVLGLWREATIRAAAEHARAAALSRPWRLKVLIRGWRRLTHLSSLFRRKTREDVLKIVATTFQRWKRRYRERMLTVLAVQKDVRAILRDKEKILLSTVLRSWRSFAASRALTTRAYRTVIANRKSQWFSELRVAVSYRVAQRQIAGANANRYTRRVLQLWHRLSRQRKRERFVLCCLLDARENALYSAAWATWRHATFHYQRASEFWQTCTTKRAFASWRAVSSRMRHLRTTSADLFAKIHDATKRQPFNKWLTFALSRRETKFEAFSCWWHIVCKRRRDRELAVCLAARENTNVLQRHWRAWQEMCTETRQARAFQMRQLGRKVLGTLIAYAEYRDTKRARDQVKLDTWANGITEKILLVWNQVATYRCRLRNSYAMAVSLRNRTLLGTVFALWWEQTEFALTSVVMESRPCGKIAVSPAPIEPSRVFERCIPSKLVAMPEANKGTDGSASVQRFSQRLLPAAQETNCGSCWSRSCELRSSAFCVTSTSATKGQRETLRNTFAAWRERVGFTTSNRESTVSTKVARATTRFVTGRTSASGILESNPLWLETESARVSYKKAHDFRSRTVLQRGFHTWQVFLRTKNDIVKKLQDEFRAVRCMRKWKAAFARRKTLHALAHVQRHYLHDLDQYEPPKCERTF